MFIQFKLYNLRIITQVHRNKQLKGSLKSEKAGPYTQSKAVETNEQSCHHHSISNVQIHLMMGKAMEKPR